MFSCTLQRCGNECHTGMPRLTIKSSPHCAVPVFEPPLHHKNCFLAYLVFAEWHICIPWTTFCWDKDTQKKQKNQTAWELMEAYYIRKNSGCITLLLYWSETKFFYHWLPQELSFCRCMCHISVYSWVCTYINQVEVPPVLSVTCLPFGEHPFSGTMSFSSNAQSSGIEQPLGSDNQTLKVKKCRGHCILTLYATCMQHNALAVHSNFMPTVPARLLFQPNFSSRQYQTRTALALFCVDATWRQITETSSKRIQLLGPEDVSSAVNVGLSSMLARIRTHSMTWIQGTVSRDGAAVRRPSSVLSKGQPAP